MAQSSESPGRSKHRKNKDRKSGWRRAFVAWLAEWAVSRFIWLLRLTCRVRIVHGQAHLDAALARGTAVVPCAWHQRLVPSALFLRAQRSRGMRVGFLISPSREGLFMCRVARAHKVEAICGSSSRTGKEAMRALTEAVGVGISPMMYGDGPRGPARVFKPGAVVLASRAGAPLFLVGAAASRYWQVKSWDSCHVPKPFCRFDIAIDAPWPVGALEGTQQAEDIAAALGQRLDVLNKIAETGSPPSDRRRSERSPPPRG
ncbi:lysophospholipid acyltransferase family protein [Salinisphaera sp.]|uniref:lysophospholipid acyltransferase family protein n=1 Tax=Salinisphaera sp. TaxID=1914330 RepID=UPI002D765ABC|nr:DUF374 domain-containing protein [Salinisphaera sp.]HET7314117.1 DUF374 domain-containing protein [Salinisphaera sp.]